MADCQRVDLIFVKIGLRSEKKVNDFWKFGVDFWKFGVLTKTRKVAKFERKTCTIVGHVCKSSSFAAQFFIGQLLPKARKRPFFALNCFLSVNKIFCERFWHFGWEHIVPAPFPSETLPPAFPLHWKAGRWEQMRISIFLKHFFSKRGILLRKKLYICNR